MSEITITEYLELLKNGQPPEIPEIPEKDTIILNNPYRGQKFWINPDGSIKSHYLDDVYEYWRKEWTRRRVASNEERIEIMKQEGIKTLKDDLSILDKDYSNLYQICDQPLIGFIYLLEYNALSNYSMGKMHKVVRIEGEKALLKDVGIFKKIEGELEIVPENAWFPLEECWELKAALRWDKPFIIDAEKEIEDLIEFVKKWFEGKAWNEVSFRIGGENRDFQWYKNSPIYGEIKHYLHIYRHLDDRGYGPVTINEFRPFN